MGKQWVPRRLRVSDISYGHSPDKRGERTDKYGRLPIHVKPCWGGYRVHDGNDRLYYAKQRGDTHIDAYVLEEASEQSPAPAKRDRKNIGFGLYWQ